MSVQERSPLLMLSLGLAVFLVFLVGSATAQGLGKRIYDSTRIETVTGTVEEVRLVSMGSGRSGTGVHLMVNTGTETLEVHLGPRFYLDANGVELEPGDTIEVTGSRVTLENEPALLVREIQIGEVRLALREENGTPLWAGAAVGDRGPGRSRAHRGTCPCGCRDGRHQHRCCH